MGGLDVLKLAFRYSMDEEGWVPCTDSEMAERDIETLKYVLLVKDAGDEADGLYLRCPEHRKDEKIAYCENGEIVSEEGCKFDGLVGIGEKKSKNSNPYESFKEDHKSKFVPFRWRIFQSNDNSPMNIAADVLYTDMVFSSSSMKWRNFSFSIDLSKRKMVISKIKCCPENLTGFAYSNSSSNSMKEWTEATGVDIPDVVEDVVLDLLREWIGNKYGIKPTVLSQLKGASKIKAFVTRPFDLNVVFLKPFLKDFIMDGKSKDDFDKVFPYEQKDNYEKICNCLEIEPPKILRRAYMFNPYSIVWYMIFTQWGIDDINLMQKFLYLEDHICGVRLQNLFYNKEQKKVLCCENEFCKQWYALVFYCKWMVERKREKILLPWIYSVSTENTMSDLEWNMLREFCNHFNDLSDEVKDRLARDGFTTYVHDSVHTEIANLSHKWDHRAIHYEDKFLSYECRINQYEFRLVHDTAMLSKLGVIFHMVVASHRERLIRNESIIVYLLDASEYLAFIEIYKSGYIVQANGV